MYIFVRQPAILTPAARTPEVLATLPRSSFAFFVVSFLLPGCCCSRMHARGVRPSAQTAPECMLPRGVRPSAHQPPAGAISACANRTPLSCVPRSARSPRLLPCEEAVESTMQSNGRQKHIRDLRAETAMREHAWAMGLRGKGALGALLETCGHTNTIKKLDKKRKEKLTAAARRAQKRPRPSLAPRAQIAGWPAPLRLPNARACACAGEREREGGVAAGKG
jgi:hypothetical protein